MKKVIRLLWSLTLLAGLAVAQLPSSSDCQMISGQMFSSVCAMPCCTKKLPMAKCPMMKASAPRDLVAINELRSDKILQPVHFLSLTALEMPRKVILRLASFVKSIQSIFLTPQQSVRAPPSDVHLQDA